MNQELTQKEISNDDPCNAIGPDHRRTNSRGLDRSGPVVAGNRYSIYEGVSWHKRRQKWVAYARLHGQQKHLGCFDDELEAAIAHCYAIKRAPLVAGGQGRSAASVFDVVAAFAILVLCTACAMAALILASSPSESLSLGVTAGG